MCYSFPSDVWAAGIMMYWIVCGDFPFRVRIDALSSHHRLACLCARMSGRLFLFSALACAGIPFGCPPRGRQSCGARRGAVAGTARRRWRRGRLKRRETCSSVFAVDVLAPVQGKTKMELARRVYVEPPSMDSGVWEQVTQDAKDIIRCVRVPDARACSCVCLDASARPGPSSPRAHDTCHSMRQGRGASRSRSGRRGRRQVRTHWRKARSLQTLAAGAGQRPRAPFLLTSCRRRPHEQEAAPGPHSPIPPATCSGAPRVSGPAAFAPPAAGSCSPRTPASAPRRTSCCSTSGSRQARKTLCRLMAPLDPTHPGLGSSLAPCMHARAEHGGRQGQAAGQRRAAAHARLLRVQRVQEGGAPQTLTPTLAATGRRLCTLAVTVTAAQRPPLRPLPLRAQPPNPKP